MLMDSTELQWMGFNPTHSPHFPILIANFELFQFIFYWTRIHMYIQMYVSSFVCKSDTNTYTCMHGMFSPSAPKRRPNVLSFVPSCGTITQIFSFVEADLHKKSAINVDDAITMEHIFKPHITPEPIFKTNRTVIECKCLKLFYWITKISDRTNQHWKIEYSIWTMCECTWSTNKQVSILCNQH